MDDGSVTQPTPYGSVEQFKERMRRFITGEGLYPFAIGTIEAIITDLRVSDAEKVRRVTNALIAVGRVDGERAADPSGFGYSRADDEGPAEDMTLTKPGRIPPHYEDGREPCSGC